MLKLNFIWVWPLFRDHTRCQCGTLKPHLNPLRLICWFPLKAKQNIFGCFSVPFFSWLRWLFLKLLAPRSGNYSRHLWPFTFFDRVYYNQCWVTYMKDVIHCSLLTKYSMAEVISHITHYTSVTQLIFMKGAFQQQKCSKTYSAFNRCIHRKQDSVRLKLKSLGGTVLLNKCKKNEPVIIIIINAKIELAHTHPIKRVTLWKSCAFSSSKLSTAPSSQCTVIQLFDRLSARRLQQLM